MNLAEVSNWVNAKKPTLSRKSLSMNHLDVHKDEELDETKFPKTPLPLPILKRRNNNGNNDGCTTGKRLRFASTIAQYNYETRDSEASTAPDGIVERNDVITKNERNLPFGAMASAKSMPDLNIQPRTPTTLGRIAKAAGMEVGSAVWKASMEDIRNSSPAFNNTDGVIKQKPNTLNSMSKYILEFLQGHGYVHTPSNSRNQANTSDDFFKWVRFIATHRCNNMEFHLCRFLPIHTTLLENQACHRRTREEDVKFTLGTAARISYQQPLKRNDILNPMALCSKQRSFTFLVELIHFVQLRR